MDSWILFFICVGIAVYIIYITYKKLGKKRRRR